MKFTWLKIQNFLTVGEAEVSLTDRGLLLIQGKNLDDPSAESNGAGKSSVVDALCWALYGTTARGVSGDAVVNKTAKKDCRVTISVMDGAHEYHIARHRKHGGGKNAVVVGRVVGSDVIDMSKSTDKETQEVINKVIGCSLEVFMSSVYCGQDQMVDLPGATDKMLKTLIEEAAGIEVLTEAYAVARSQYTNAKASYDTANALHAAGLSKRLELEDDLAEVKRRMSDFEDGRKASAKTELAKILPIKAEIAKIQALPAIDEVAAGDEIAALGVKLDEHRAEQAKLDVLQQTATRADRALVSAKMQLDAALLAVKKADQAILDVDSQVGTDCKSCGKTYHEADLCDVKGIREDDAALKRKEAATYLASHKVALERIRTASEAAAAYKGSMTDVSATAARMRVLMGEATVLAERRASIKSHEHEIVRHNDAARIKLTEENPWARAVESKEKEIATHDASMAKQVEHLAACTYGVELLADAVKVFGPAGVRAHILDTVTPYLNDRTQEYLGALADGNIHAVWSTLTKTGKGELKEKFNIEVQNDKGAESFAGLSGGEKRKVRLATAMALQDMVASRATKPISLFVADEVDHALDGAGLERLMGVLERKARERGTVLVISHNSLADWIPEVITVTKKDGYATLDGATHGV